jgi:hypothetical protein
MTAPRRLARVELALPLDLARIQIQRIQPIMQRNFVGELEVACIHAVLQFLPFYALLLEFRTLLLQGCLSVAPAIPAIGTQASKLRSYYLDVLSMAGAKSGVFSNRDHQPVKHGTLQSEVDIIEHRRYPRFRSRFP